MFGVQPTRAATEYGYIRPGPAIRPGLFAIERFVEKPDAETAARYVAEGYLWNSGNFVFRAGFPAGRISPLRAGQRRRRRGGDRSVRRRSRLRHPRCGRFRPRHREIDRLRADGAHRPRGGHAGVLWLVGRRLLAGGLGIVGARRRRQCRAGRGRLCRYARLVCRQRQAARRASRRRQCGRRDHRRCGAGGAPRGRRRLAPGRRAGSRRWRRRSPRTI